MFWGNPVLFEFVDEIGDDWDEAGLVSDAVEDVQLPLALKFQQQGTDQAEPRGAVQLALRLSGDVQQVSVEGVEAEERDIEKGVAWLGGQPFAEGIFLTAAREQYPDWREGVFPRSLFKD